MADAVLGTQTDCRSTQPARASNLTENERRRPRKVKWVVQAIQNPLRVRLAINNLPEKTKLLPVYPLDCVSDNMGRESLLVGKTVVPPRQRRDDPHVAHLRSRR